MRCMIHVGGWLAKHSLHGCTNHADQPTPRIWFATAYLQSQIMRRRTAIGAGCNDCFENEEATRPLHC
jgi:hypothetical protein